MSSDIERARALRKKFPGMDYDTAREKIAGCSSLSPLAPDTSLERPVERRPPPAEAVARAVRRKRRTPQPLPAQSVRLEEPAVAPLHPPVRAPKSTRAALLREIEADVRDLSDHALRRLLAKVATEDAVSGSATESLLRAAANLSSSDLYALQLKVFEVRLQETRAKQGLEEAAVARGARDRTRRGARSLLRRLLGRR